MQTITAASMLAVLAIASGLIATGYTPKVVRPNGVILRASSGAVMVVKVG